MTEQNGKDDKSLVTTSSEQHSGLSVLNLLDEHQLASAEVFLKKMIATVYASCAFSTAVSA